MLTLMAELVRITNPKYVLLYKNLYSYYDQKITFGIDSEYNVVLQFPIRIHPYTQGPVSLY